MSSGLILFIVLVVVILILVLVAICNTTVNSTYDLLVYTRGDSVPRLYSHYAKIKQNKSSAVVTLLDQTLTFPVATTTSNGTLYSGIFYSLNTTGPWVYVDKFSDIPDPTNVLNAQVLTVGGKGSLFYTISDSTDQVVLTAMTSNLGAAGLSGSSIMTLPF